MTDTGETIAPDRASGLYRKKPVTITAVQWTGANLEEVQALTGRAAFAALDEHDRVNCDDPEATAQVFDKLHSTWVLVFDGQWVIRGVKGEFYPCAPDVFAETYEPADSAPPPDRDALADLVVGWLEPIGEATVTHDELVEQTARCVCARELLATIGQPS